LSEVLIAELKGADLVVSDTPMHNFTLPSVLKRGSIMWSGHVARFVGRQRARSAIAGIGSCGEAQPSQIAVSGGSEEGGEPRPRTVGLL